MRGLAAAAVFAIDVAAGTIAPSSGRPIDAPPALSNVRLDRCFFVMNIFDLPRDSPARPAWADHGPGGQPPILISPRSKNDPLRRKWGIPPTVARPARSQESARLPATTRCGAGSAAVAGRGATRAAASYAAHAAAVAASSCGSTSRPSHGP